MKGALVGGAMAIVLCGAGPARAACTFPYLNLGSFLSGDRAAGHFARIEGGMLSIGNADRQHATISGCAPDAHYRLTIGTSAPVRVSNGGASLDLVPFVVSVNGAPLPTPIDLSRDNSLVLTGNPDLEIVLAVAGMLALTPGTYSGGYVMQFIDS